MLRDRWVNLNGRWQFEIDPADTGLERGLLDRELDGSILVPFAPESEASGVGHVDFMEAVWYRRDIQAPWETGRTILHFGAVDYDTTVWIDGREVGRHRGGFSSFSFDVTEHLTPGRASALVVRARDARLGVQARGKQANWYANTHCHYTRTTGIWQTVWLESVPDSHVRRLRVTPQLGDGSLTVEADVADPAGHRLLAVVSDADGEAARAEAPLGLDLAATLRLPIPPERLRPWSPADPHLYDLAVTVLDAEGRAVDEVRSYAGMRSVAIDGDRLLLNGEPVFQRLVLDQGYWPETLMTAPDDAALVRDIELAMAAGFNGARLHQKAFEERFFHHADRMGYLVWAEFGDWGVSGNGPAGHNQQPTAAFVGEWLELLARDHNHPSIVGWCPLNETHQLMHDRTTALDDVTLAMFLATKLADPSRPVIDASGYSHRVSATDVYDSHSYEQDPEAFRRQQAGLAQGEPYRNRDARGEVSVPYRGQPFFVSEFGGVWWNPEAETTGEDRAESWGYGQRVRDEEAFYERFSGLVAVLAEDPRMFGYCYTQLTDVFQEQNGIYRFDRSDKLDVDRIRAAQSAPPAYERRR
nr:sugar-binding domain-containing protein [Glycomyces amatae]